MDRRDLIGALVTAGAIQSSARAPLFAQAGLPGLQPGLSRNDAASSSARQDVTLHTFGAVGDGSADDTEAMFRARDFIALTGARLVILPGDYKYTRSPNWAIPQAEIVASGRVRFYYTGTDNALIFDGGQTATDLCYGVSFGVANRIHVYGTPQAKNGVYVRSTHHSRIGVNVHGCGTSHAGLLVEFAVCTEFDVVVSGNEGGWYRNARPARGYDLSRRLPIETTSYCFFPNPVVEAVRTGIHLRHTLGNVFVGGTSEGCLEYGVLCDEGSHWDRFIGTDFEVNTIADISCNGLGIEFLSCDTYDSLIFGSKARRCVLKGGGHENILVDPGATGCSIIDTVYDRRGTGGTLVDSGSGTTVSNVRSGVAPFNQALTGSLSLPQRAVGFPGSFAAVLPVLGAKIGDFAVAASDAPLTGLQISAHCNAPNQVTVTLSNVSGQPTVFPACRIHAKILRGR